MFSILRAEWPAVRKRLESCSAASHNAQRHDTWSVGIDLVQVSRVAASLAQFGERFLRRVFTDGEIAYATAAPALTAERLAARFAAKEAAHQGARARRRRLAADRGRRAQPSGECALRLHGAARAAADEPASSSSPLSLSHEGDYATAVVIAMRTRRLTTR